MYRIYNFVRIKPRQFLAEIQHYLILKLVLPMFNIEDNLCQASRV